MTKLNENQLLLLDNLIYLKGVVVESKKSTTVKQVVVNLLDRGGLELSKIEEKKGTDGEYPTMMSYDRWREILTNIKEDTILMSLKVTNPRNQIKTKTVNGEVHKIGGMRAACFVDASGGATVVFRGTSGAFEWHDNGQGCYLPETVQQKEALDYIEGLDYNNITVTGHSKGGNKAQYVGILSNKIDRCISFDGQGFSQEFIDANKDKIEANRQKITSISASGDYVNCLLLSVSEKRRYIETESQGKNFMQFHCPDIMLKLNGNLRDDAKQSATSKLENKFIDYVIHNVKESKRSYIIDGITAKLEGKDADESPEQQAKSKKMLIHIAIAFAMKEPKDVMKIFGDKHLHEFFKEKFIAAVSNFFTNIAIGVKKFGIKINRPKDKLIKLNIDISEKKDSTKKLEVLSSKEARSKEMYRDITRKSDPKIEELPHYELVDTPNVDPFKRQLLCNLRAKDKLNTIAMKTDDFKVKKLCSEKLKEVNINLDKVEGQTTSKEISNKTTFDDKVDYLKLKVNNLQRYLPKNKILNDENKEKQIDELSINILESNKIYGCKAIKTINEFCNISSMVIAQKKEIQEMSKIYKQIDLLQKDKINLAEIKCNLEIVEKYKPIVEKYSQIKLFKKAYENKYINEISKYSNAQKYLESKEIINLDQYNKAKKIYSLKKNKLENERSLHSPINNESAMTQRLELSKSKQIQRNFIKPLCNETKTKVVTHNKEQSLEI